MNQHKVLEASTLGQSLALLLPDSSGRTRKAVLESGRVRVNGRVAKVGRLPLAAGDLVEIVSARAAAPSSALPDGIKVVFADEHLLVVDKPAGLLTIGTTKERERTLYRRLSAWVKLAERGAKIFIVHRLDRDASGLLVFARRPEIKRHLQEQLKARTMERTYLAEVTGQPSLDSGTVDAPLSELGEGRVRIDPRGREARTHYRVIARHGATSTLEVKLESGRKHQIRAHLESLGHPIVGDHVYGRGGGGPRLLLHARSLGFSHPVTNERRSFSSPPPRAFRRGR